MAGTRKIYYARVQSDDEGLFVVIPEEIGFGTDVELVVEQRGNEIIFQKKSPPLETPDK